MDKYGYVKCQIVFRTKKKIIPSLVFLEGTLFWHDDWDGILAEAKAEMVKDPLMRVFLKPDDLIERIDVIPLEDAYNSYFFDINKTVMEIVCEAVEKEPFKTVFNVRFLRPSGTPDVINYIAKDRCHWEYGTRSKIIDRVKKLLKDRSRHFSSITSHCLIYRIDIDKDKRIIPLDHSEMFYVADVLNAEEDDK